MTRADDHDIIIGNKVFGKNANKRRNIIFIVAWVYMGEKKNRLSFVHVASISC